MADDNIRYLDRLIKTASAAKRALPKSSGGGTSDGMDAWQQSVETRLGDLSTDIRDLGKKVDTLTLWVVGAIAAGFLVVLGLINTKADQINSRLDGLTSQTAQVGERIAKLEGAAETKPPPIAPKR